jgi:hypothetical protein
MDIEIPDVEFYDTSHWLEQVWLNSGGTRSKKILLSSEDYSEYYFKRSEWKPATGKNPEKHYKYEFWSEILAYQIGKSLGLNVLRYDVALNDEELGCLSPKMNETDEEELIEVGRFMTAINTDFFPDDPKTRKEYTFQLLEDTIAYFSLEKYWPEFIKTLLFDALIGNTDRHQENWAFLGKPTQVAKGLKEMEADLKKIDEKMLLKAKWYLRLIVKTFIKSFIDVKRKSLRPKIRYVQLRLYTKIARMAPSYDNGSSMGRELSDKRVECFFLY